MLSLRFVPGFGIIGLRTVPVPGVTQPDEVIDVFPEFSDDINKIKDPKDVASEQKAKERLRKVAKRIVASHKGGVRKIIGFEVHGHSDQTVRMQAGPQRDQFEQGISEDRGENCKEMLLQMIEEEGGTPFIGGIKANATSKGFGSKHRIFKPAKTVPQMEKNRRVEIFLREFIDPPPTPPPPPPPPTPPETGSNWSIQILAGQTLAISNPTPIPAEVSSFTITLTFEVVDKDRKQKAKFQYVGTGVAAPSLAVGPKQTIQTQTVTQGTPVPFQTTKGTTLDKFAGGSSVDQAPGAGVSVLSTGGNFEFTFSEMQKLENGGVLVKGKRVVSVNAGQGFLTQPSAGFGGTTGGKIVMIGGIQPVK